MIKPISQSLLHWFLLTLVVVGCTSSSTLPEMPDIGIPAEEVNGRIRLVAPAGWNTYKIGEVIGLDVEVVSDDSISFPFDYGAVIFYLDGGEWIEVRNMMEYPEGRLILTNSNGDPSKHGDARVAPLFPDSKKPLKVRIFLVGEFYRDGQSTQEQTAAYIDLELNP